MTNRRSLKWMILETHTMLFQARRTLRAFRRLLLERKLNASLSTLNVNSDGFKSSLTFSEKLMLVSSENKWLASPGNANWIIYTPLEKVWGRVTSKQEIRDTASIVELSTQSH